MFGKSQKEKLEEVRPEAVEHSANRPLMLLIAIILVVLISAAGITTYAFTRNNEPEPPADVVYPRDERYSPLPEESVIPDEK